MINNVAKNVWHHIKLRQIKYQNATTEIPCKEVKLVMQDNNSPESLETEMGCKQMNKQN